MYIDIFFHTDKHHKKWKFLLTIKVALYKETTFLITKEKAWPSILCKTLRLVQSLLEIAEVSWFAIVVEIQLVASWPLYDKFPESALQVQEKHVSTTMGKITLQFESKGTTSTLGWTKKPGN